LLGLIVADWVMVQSLFLLLADETDVELFGFQCPTFLDLLLIRDDEQLLGHTQQVY